MRSQSSRLNVAVEITTTYFTAQVLSYRNRLVKTWAASVDAVSFVDFEAMARDSHRPPRAKGDIHWMCWLRWLSDKVRECECLSETNSHIHYKSFLQPRLPGAFSAPCTWCAG